ncbi:unnamed protein product, partial [Closterium sp. NIES-54]
MFHAAAPHFLWPFAVRYAAEQLNLWPRVSHLETSPTLRWAGEVGNALAFRVGVPSLLSAICLRASSLHALFVHLLLPSSPPSQFPGTPPASLPRGRSPPPIAPLPPPSPAPSGVSHVDPPPLVEPLEVSSNTSGAAEGRDPTPAATVTPRRSACLAVPPGFQPRPSSPPLQLVAVDSGAAGGGTTGGTSAGGPAMSRQEALSPERLREWAVQWGSPGGGASRLRAGGAGIAGVGGTGSTGGGGSATGGTGVARAGSTSARRQETLSPERLREWVVQWGSLGGGASRARSPRAGGTGGAEIPVLPATFHPLAR